MKIFVCVKQVPNTETKIQLSSDGNSIESSNIKWIVNPYDEFAIEEALNLKTKNAGSTVTVISMGPKGRVTDAVRTALAMGADDGIIINCEEEQDLFTTAKALAETIKAEGDAEIIFAGKLAIDGNSSGLPQVLAEYLSLPHATVVSSFEDQGGKYLVERETESGSTKTYELTGPCVISANKGLNTPRYASLPGIMKAKKKPIKDVELSSLNIPDNFKKLSYTNLSLPPSKPSVKMIDGEAGAQASQLVELLKNEAKVL